MSLGIGGIGTGGYSTGAETNKIGVKPGYQSAPGECKTCATRTYRDGSDENVSFKSGAHVSPTQAGAAVRAHEGEHVKNAFLKAAESGGKVLSVGVSIHTAVCEECGRVYVSGGTTNTVTSTPKDDPYSKSKSDFLAMLNKGMRADFKV